MAGVGDRQPEIIGDLGLESLDVCILCVSGDVVVQQNDTLDAKCFDDFDRHQGRRVAPAVADDMFTHRRGPP